MIGLPPHIQACLFDLDGVLTSTTRLHIGAWKQAFDDFLRKRAEETGDDLYPFDPAADYTRYVDGRRRADGVRTFLASRGIELPEGDPADAPGMGTVNALGNLKNTIVVAHMDTEGVDERPGARAYLQAAEKAGLRRVVVSSSANAAKALALTGLDRLIEARVDGVVARERDLPGKPDPATFLYGAELAGVDPASAAVFEDAVAGVQAGRAGAFGFVVGIDDAGQADALREAGADIVVPDLGALL
ncbi:HAD family hydrolase [Propionicicella superfundia]|uniref:HAD family hydrolase n=1 Tax=Propionicicella superfundia TaxID=348582 RepID=UPI000422F654|nr:HAD-IA family hydrolase [Propionicicella superfundia]